ncbi:putative glycolipid-binding domain-containing protein [Compostimonas suwonensis]|uniref:Putative glycolipid-binding protein n=1 Tax=Compostimonas suwonensis TaxID=1048394 RepID=A0A2M9BWN8_9MICO|nr:putative glycolipid-binding domain-containing protein [Compostimonas suwonensis]PJJ62366.1 putative glycolipid-binding protein [Compostimonas suwonensis]
MGVQWGAQLAAARTAHRITGCTTAVEEGEAWSVSYEIVVDGEWMTRHAVIRNRTVSGEHSATLDHDGSGRWLVGGAPAPAPDGCPDVDLESSAMTNAFPAVHALQVLLIHTIGSAAFEVPRRDDPDPQSRRARGRAEASRIGGHTGRLSEPMSRFPGDEVFRSGLDWLLDGMTP